MDGLLCAGFILVAFIAVSQTERCASDGDCFHVSCDNNTHLACSHAECTCIYGGNSCNARSCKVRSECMTSGCHCSNPGDVWHCYDRRCACGRSPIGK